MSEEEKVCCEDAQEEELKEDQQAGASEEETEIPEEAAEDAPKEEPAEKQEEAIDYHDKWLRVTAEYQNYRTRTIKEKEEIYQNANAKFIEGLLEVIDNFERAMQTKPEGDKFAEGIELIYKQFLAVLEKNHVKEIPAKGEKFDPKVHMAVQMMAVEGMESDCVAEVIKKGYMMNDKVIRPAMVVVSQ